METEHRGASITEYAVILPKPRRRAVRFCLFLQSNARRRRDWLRHRGDMRCPGCRVAASPRAPQSKIIPAQRQCNHRSTPPCQWSVATLVRPFQVPFLFRSL